MTGDLRARIRALDWACARAEAAIDRWIDAGARAAHALSDRAEVA